MLRGRKRAIAAIADLIVYTLFVAAFFAGIMLASGEWTRWVMGE